MTNMDKYNEKKLDLKTKFCEALKNDDAEGVAKAFDELSGIIKEEVSSEFKEYQRNQDAIILEKAGIKQYTSVEIKAFQNVINCAKEASGISVPANAFPPTFIDRILNDVVKESPLLQAVNITNVGFLTTMILDDSTDEAATWTGMGEAIQTGNVKLDTLSLQSFKLGKIIYVPNEMLDMGPEWIGNYVERKLKLCIKLGLEAGIVSGDGSKGPIGMTRTRTQGTEEGGKYKEKTPVQCKSFEPVEYGKLVSKFVLSSKNNQRAFDKAILVAHPTTILTKILPATAVRKTDGTYSEMQFPFPTIVIPSVAVPVDKAVLGIHKKYEMFIGTGTSKEGKIVEDTSIRFIENMTAIRVLLYGNGSFVDENDNIYLDLTGLEPHNQKVVVVNDGSFPAPAAAAAEKASSEETSKKK